MATTFDQRLLSLFLTLSIVAIITAIVLWPPGVAAQAGQTAEATVNVNVRQGPSTETPILTTLRAGTVVEILGTDGDFSRIRTDSGLEGYLKTTYLANYSRVAEPEPVLEPVPEPPVAFEEPAEPEGLAEPPSTETSSVPPPPAPATGGVTELDTMQVTGTRILQSNLLSSVPLQTVDSFQIDLTGEANTGDIVRNLPVAGVSALTPTNSNFLVSQAGITTVDLRNLGEDRTLVLVNGRRFVSGIPGSQVVDFNSIPTDFIERIDVITGGASAVYGSDALSGVVNIVLKKDFEGVVLSGQTGQTFEQEDDVQQFLRITGGSTFGEGRGHALFNGSFHEAKGVFARDRALTRTDCVNLAFFTDDPADFQQCLAPFFSSFPPNTRIIMPDGANPDGSGITSNQVIDPTSGDVRPFVSATDGFNRQSIRALSTPLERRILSSILNYEVTPAVNAFFEGSYARTTAISELEPFPLSSEDIFGGQLPTCSDTDDNGDLDTCDLTSGVPLSSGIVPQALRDAVLAANPELTNDTAVVGFARRLTEVGNRGSTASRETFRVVTGLDGDLLQLGGLDSTEFLTDARYEVSYNYGTTTDNQVSGGQLNAPNLRESFNVEPDPGVPGQLRCANAVAREEGCAPTHIFGLNTIGPDALAYIVAPVLRTVNIEQQVFNGYVTGHVGRIPTGGPIGLSFGYEYRDERSSDIPDALTQTGQNASNQISPQIGGFRVDEWFAEVELPVVVGAPLADYLAVKGALRLSDYTTVGDTTAYSLGAEWAPNQWARLRGQYARAVRAPNIGELFSTGGETFETVLDPCRGVTVDGGDPIFFNTRHNPSDPSVVLASGLDESTRDSILAQNCIADPAIASRVTATGGLALTQAEAQGTGGFIGASPPLGTLTEETADSYTFGFVFTPRTGNPWTDAVTLSIDYYDIEIEDAIALIDRDLSLNECYSETQLSFGPGNEFCVNVERFASGPQIGALDEVNGGILNIANLKTSGVDVQLSYGFRVNDVFDSGRNLGRFMFSTAYTRLLEHENTVFTAFSDDKGKVGFSEDKALLNFLYGVGPVTANWEITYIGEADVDVLDVDDRAGHLPAVMFHDVQVRLALAALALPGTLVFGVDNVFDEFVQVGGTGGDLGQPTGSRTFPDVYEPFGRAWYTGVRFDFK